VCILLVFLRYVDHDAWFTECKVCIFIFKVTPCVLKIH